MQPLNGASKRDMFTALEREAREARIPRQARMKLYICLLCVLGVDRRRRCHATA